MTAGRIVLAAVAIAAAPLLATADNARPRGGGSSSGSSSSGSSSSGSSSSGSSSSGNSSSSSSSSSGSTESARSRHPSSSSSARERTSSSSSSRRDSDSEASSTRRSATEQSDLTEAQRRHPRAGSGTGGYRNRGRGDHGRYGYYGNDGWYNSRRYYYPGYSYYGGYGWGYDRWYSPYYYSGYYGYAPHYNRYRYRESGSLRLLVEPEKTRVYVDGYYAGIVDDFDGIFQRLYLPPGRHEVMLKLDGHRTHRVKVYVPIDQTIKVHHDMTEGAGESQEVMGGPHGYGNDYDRDRLEDRDRNRRRADRDDDDADDGVDREEEGVVRLRVRPGDASVYVDGTFRGSGRDVESLDLGPGRHRVEVVRPGFRTVERDVEVRSGRSAEVDIELEKN